MPPIQAVRALPSPLGPLAGKDSEGYADLLEDFFGCGGLMKRVLMLFGSSENDVLQVFAAAL